MQSEGDISSSQGFIRLHDDRTEKKPSLFKPVSNVSGLTNSDADAYAECSMSIDQVATLHKTRVSSSHPTASQGLPASEAAARLRINGLNKPISGKKPSSFLKFIKCLVAPFNVLLIIAGILDLTLLKLNFTENHSSEWVGPILISVAFFNALFEFVQLRRATSILNGLLETITTNCKVIRDGRLLTINTEELVLGDLVLVCLGDLLPADLYLVYTSDCRLDNSTLTGESKPQSRSACVDSNALRLDEAKNIGLQSACVVAGEAIGIVIRTGDKTSIGRTARLANVQKKRQSLLAKETKDFIWILTAIALSVTFIFIMVGLFATYKSHKGSLIIFAVTILVSFLPEGLPATVTCLLSISAQKLAKEKVLVKNLQAVETLGSLTMLCTDKTGTLTQNLMQVAAVATPEHLMSASIKPKNQYFLPLQPAVDGFDSLMRVCALCSTARYDSIATAIEDRKFYGDATEIGLAKFASQHLNYDLTREKNRIVKSLPFNSDNKFSVTIVDRSHAKGDLTLYIKGAPEVILACCSTVLLHGEAVAFSEDHQVIQKEAYKAMCEAGQRVIACAQVLLSGSEYSHSISPTDDMAASSMLNDLCYIGLIGLEDPLKEGAREAVTAIRQAGIQMIMITGDHPDSAESMARKAGIITGETRNWTEKGFREGPHDAKVVTGAMLAHFTKEDWHAIFSCQELVFARTTPIDKLEIIKQAQLFGHIVGHVGDSFNDCCALQKADLGVSMHQTGANASKEAADVIIMDDDFSTLVDGIRVGRQVFVNLKRSIQYTLSHSVPEILPQILYVLVPIPLPISPILILVIDVGFELLASISFVWDVVEDGKSLMRKPPRYRVGPKISGSPAESARIFSKRWWSQKWCPSGNEHLIDGSLLSYAYLQSGILQAAVAMVIYFLSFQRNGFQPSELRQMQKQDTYFMHNSPEYVNFGGQVKTASDQVSALAQAQSAVFISIFVMQAFNLFAVKAHEKLPFGKHIVANQWSFICVLLGAVLTIFTVYLAPLNIVFGTSRATDPIYLAIAFAGGVLLLSYASLRIVIKRAFSS